MYIYIHVYIYICVCIIYIYVYLYTHIHIWIYICICIYICIYVYIFIYIYIHTHVYTYRYLYMYSHQHHRGEICKSSCSVYSRVWFRVCVTVCGISDHCVTEFVGKRGTDTERGESWGLEIHRVGGWTWINPRRIIVATKYWNNNELYLCVCVCVWERERERAWRVVPFVVYVCACEQV